MTAAVYVWGMRRSWLVVVAVVLAGIGGAWWWSSRTDDAVSGAANEPASTVVAQGATAPASRASTRTATDDAEGVAKTKRRISKAERDEVRKKIVDAIEASRTPSRTGEPSSADEAADAPSPERQGAPGNIKDRTGGKLDGFVGAINEDFLPLADECYQQALQTQPDLGGLLDLEFSIIADEEVGGLVDEIEVGKENQLQHEGMLECIRESMLSTYFPSPEDTGQRDIRLTMLFDADGE